MTAAMVMFGCAQSERGAEAAAVAAASAPAADPCAGLMPAAAPEPIDLVLCGSGGESAALAFGDAYGDLALGCAAGGAAEFGLYLAYRSGYLSKAPLGIAVWAASDGFVGETAGGPFELHARDGSTVAAIAGAHVLAGPRSLLVATVGGGAVSVQAFGGAPRAVASAPRAPLSAVRATPAVTRS